MVSTPNDHALYFGPDFIGPFTDEVAAFTAQAAGDATARSPRSRLDGSLAETEVSGSSTDDDGIGRSVEVDTSGVD